MPDSSLTFSSVLAKNKRKPCNPRQPGKPVLMQICGQMIQSIASLESLANRQSLKMQLLCTCGLLVVVVLFLASLSSLQATAWSGWGCSTRDHRGCCYTFQNPMRLRPPCAPKLKKALE